MRLFRIGDNCLRRIGSWTTVQYHPVDSTYESMSACVSLGGGKSIPIRSLKGTARFWPDMPVLVCCTPSGIASDCSGPEEYIWKSCQIAAVSLAVRLKTIRIHRGEIHLFDQDRKSVV